MHQNLAMLKGEEGLTIRCIGEMIMVKLEVIMLSFTRMKIILLMHSCTSLFTFRSFCLLMELHA